MQRLTCSSVGYMNMIGKEKRAQGVVRTAFCLSRHCAKKGRYENTSTGVIKDVPFTATVCPDCNSVLVWKRRRGNG